MKNDKPHINIRGKSWFLIVVVTVLLWLGIIMLITGCQFEFEGEEIIDPQLSEHYEAFLHEATMRGVDLPDRAVLLFIDPDHTSSRAHCDWNHKRATIRISKEFYDYYMNIKNAPYQIEATVFHELGHGLLDRHHIEQDPDGLPSLMVVGGYRYDYVERRTEYIDELFNSKQ